MLPVTTPELFDLLGGQPMRQTPTVIGSSVRVDYIREVIEPIRRYRVNLKDHRVVKHAAAMECLRPELA